jgi:hypothetical protein
MAYDSDIIGSAGLDGGQNLRNLPFGFCRQFRGAGDKIEKKSDRGLRERVKSLPEYSEYLFFLHGNRGSGGDVCGLDFRHLVRLCQDLSSAFVLDDDFTRLPVIFREKNDKRLLGSA